MSAAIIGGVLILVLLILWMSGFNLCLGLNNDQSNIYSAIKAETKTEFLKYHAKLDMSEDEIKDYLEGYMAMPIGWVVGGDAWEKYHEQYMKYVRPSSINNSSS